ncbi:hypothetical protein GHK86_03985 [Acidimicrobiaceae bacterium USS-CC1]|uniref:HEPN AbiU2-like domain-containing protein n=1 Tax=Acidiferrimicrobium australe TaxID=2664430 RepID=A0ABW9QRA4_9ACTN|nr:hypothetical protein [Acidiferrimicrobium australe]
MYSQHILWMRTKQKTVDDAWADIEDRLIPPVMAAISTLGGLPPRLEMMRIGETDPHGKMDQVVAPWSSSQFAAYDSATLSDKGANELLQHWSLACGLGAIAASLFHEAVEQQDRTAPSRRGIGNTVLSYFLVVEYIANNVTSQDRNNRRDDDNYTKQADSVVNELRVKLDRTQSIRKKAAAVSYAKNALDRLDLRFLSLRIEHAGHVLDIDQSAIDTALALSKLRNTTLAHAGSSAHLPADGPTLDDAWRTAQAFLTGFLAFHADSRHGR